MKDDWSLKGKKINASFDYDAGIVLDDEEFERIYIGPKSSIDYYPVKVIETLRKKLIEDILELSGKYIKESDVLPARVLPVEVKKIINKRFEVDK